MNHKDFTTKIFEPTLKNIVELMQVKGGEYAGDADRLANFKRNAEKLGLPPETVLMIYFHKHYDAFMQHYRDHFITKINRPRAEPIEGRIDDMINYLILYKGLLLERRENDSEWERRHLAGEKKTTDTTACSSEQVIFRSGKGC